MCVIFTRSELLFIYKMVLEIIFIPRVDSGYPHNFMVDSWVFKDDESESEAPRVCPLLVESPHFACVEHAQCPLLAHCLSVHTHTHTHTHTHDVTSPPRGDLNFPTYFTGKGGPSIFKGSMLSV